MLGAVREWLAARRYAKDSPYVAVCPKCGKKFALDRIIGNGSNPAVLVILCDACLVAFNVGAHRSHGYKVPQCSSR